MSDDSVSIVNPYVGPLTFSTEQRHLFFGREREARDLLARVLSERLLLFYAQSGAGKSSLLHTRLILQLQEEKGFVVLPVGRVGGELPAGVAQVDNIYAFNLMVSIDKGGDPARLAHVSLNDFLARLTRKTIPDAAGQECKGWVYDATPAQTAPAAPTSGASTRRYALIIDQFEEIITSHPARWQEREDFFRQLNQALLDDPNLWVVLTLREDYVAALDPYAAQMADHLRARFYMERMGVEAGLEAIRKPAELGGRPFAERVAERLVDNLRQVRVPGQEKTIAGQYIEPVQLQVVCYQLWEGLTERDERSGTEDEVRLVTAEDLAQAGDVDRALTHFYEETLAVALADPAAAGMSERQLRAWFDKELITEAGTRGLAHQSTQETAGLPNAIVNRLQKRFLVRGEARGGDTWIELVHDRFIEPIRQSNRAWFSRNLNPLTIAAQAWHEANKNSATLYTGAQLASAVAQMESSPDEFNELERDFLQASQEHAQRQSARRWRLVLAGAATLLLILASLTVWALSNAASARTNERNAKNAQATADAAKREADVQASLARHTLAGQRAAQASAAADPQVGFLLAAEAVRLSTEESNSVVPAAYQYLLNAQEPELFSPGPGSAIRLLARVPGSNKFVSIDDTSVSLWQPRAFSVMSLIATLLSDNFISAIALSPDQRWLAVASEPDTSKIAPVNLTQEQQQRSLPSLVRLWDLTAENPAQGTTIGTVEGSATTLALTSDGRRLIAGSNDGRVYIWDIENKKDSLAAAMIRAHDSAISAMAIGGPGDQWLVTGARRDGILRLWDLEAVSERPDAAEAITLQDHKDAITALAISRDGRWLASGDASGSARLWRLDNGVAARPFTGSPEPDVTPIPRGSPSPQPMATTLSVTERAISLLGHAKAIRALAFSPDNRWLVTAGADSIARLWDMRMADTGTRPITLRGHKAEVNTVGFDPGSQRLFTGSSDGTVRIWDLQAEAPGEAPNILAADTGVTTVSLDEETDQMAVGTSEGSVFQWHLRLDELVAAACRFAGRNLTIDEWGSYMPGETYHKICQDFPIHPTVVKRHIDQGRSLAADGDIVEAQEEFQLAAESDPSWGIVLADQAREILVETARDLARAGNLTDALELYEKAQSLDETLKLDADELRQLTDASKLVQDAKNLALSGTGETLFASDFIYGLHDPGGESLMLDTSKPGWIVFREAIGHDPQDQSGTDYRRWSDRGLGVIVVLANGYTPEGTLPNSALYEDFAARCANFVRNTRGAGIWVVGNEMNFAVERPGAEYDFNQNPPRLVQPGEVITPQLYARAYRLCRDAIHHVPGHANDEVLVGAAAPWNPQTSYPDNPDGDWVQYFRDILTELGPANCDGFTIHTYTHGDDPRLVDTDMLMNAPFEDRQYHFRTYRDFMNAVPADMRHLPAYITETDQDGAWRDANTGWVQRAYTEIDHWNSQPSAQKIRALILYRWTNVDKWGIEGKQGVIEDFKQALAQNYVWRTSAPPIVFIANQLPKHPTAIYNKRSLAQITHIIVHSTSAAPNVSAESIARYHVQGKGWPGIGYHYFIDDKGVIQETNTLETVSYQAAGANPYSIGIAFAGDFNDTIPTPAQIESGARLIAKLMTQLNIPIENVLGHQELSPNDTDDPGTQWLDGRRWKDMLFSRVREILKLPAPAATTQ